MLTSSSTCGILEFKHRYDGRSILLYFFFVCQRSYCYLCTIYYLPSFPTASFPPALTTYWPIHACRRATFLIVKRVIPGLALRAGADGALAHGIPRQWQWHWQWHRRRHRRAPLRFRTNLASCQRISQSGTGDGRSARARRWSKYSRLGPRLAICPIIIKERPPEARA
ncbi:hypothetical protein DFH11DRAFT_1643167 [Phellopilus nigrolimitatus]|nr:hypothetical protein DFH11DRAFT_1643167 [Phellopilus nigrolimitatus]